jgi:DNA-binding response OmpR family regulator
MRILVVEDDSKMAELLQRGLVKEGHIVDVALDGIRGLEKAQANSFDAIILDVMLPGANGLQVAKRLRASGNRTPILMLTARDSVPDVVRGLDVGADDYLSKPFSFEVLAARLRVIDRRKTMESSPVLQVSDLTLDREAHEVRRGKRAVTLSPTEFAMLEHLMRRAGRVVTRHDLIAGVWGDDHEVGSNTVDVFIFLLRSKIETGGEKRLIQTIRGFGYTVREPEA